MRKQTLVTGILGTAMLLLAGSAMAGTGGSTEFSALHQWLMDIIQGYGGRVVALASIFVGAIFSIARLNPLPILAGVAFAIFLYYGPTVADGILAAPI
jgi:conjugal transfer pilus assembly protein TraA